MSRFLVVFVVATSLFAFAAPSAVAQESALTCEAGQVLVTDEYTYTDDAGATQTYHESYCVAEAPEWESLGIPYESPCPRVDGEVWPLFRDRVIDLQATHDSILAQHAEAYGRAATDIERTAADQQRDQDLYSRVYSPAGKLKAAVDHEYETRCAAAEATAAGDGDYTADCYEELARLEGAQMALADDQGARRDALVADYDAAIETQQGAEHSDDEWTAFFAMWDAKFTDLEDSFTAEWNGFYGAHDLGACAPIVQASSMDAADSADEPTCDASIDADDRSSIEAAIQLAGDAYRSGYWGAMLEGFLAEQDAELAAFLETNPTDESVASFKAAHRAAYGELLALERDDVVLYIDSLRDEWAAFAADNTDGCVSIAGIVGSPEYFAAAARARFGLDLQQNLARAEKQGELETQLKECLAAGTPEAECQKTFDAALATLEATLDGEAAAFHDELESTWEDSFGKELEDAAFEDQFGEMTFDAEEGQAEGKYAAFSVDDASVSGVTIAGRLVFDRVGITGISEMSFDVTNPYFINFLGESASLTIYDDDSGAASCWASDGEACIWDVADYLDVTAADGHASIFAGGAAVGYIVAEGTPDIQDGNVIRLTGSSYFALPFISEGDEASPEDALLQELFLDGGLGADIDISDEGGEEKSHPITYGQYAIDVTSEEAEGGTGNDINVVIDAVEHAGTVLTFTIDYDVLAGDDAILSALADGNPIGLDWCDIVEGKVCEPVAVCIVASMQALLAHDHSGGCELVAYLAFDIENGLVHATIKVEHFSVKGIRFRNLAATAAAPLAKPTVAPTVLVTPTSAPTVTSSGSGAGAPVGASPTPTSPAKGTPAPGALAAIIAGLASALVVARRKR